MYKWFELWFDDKQNILDIMVKNMTSDLEAGYNYFGNVISRQREDIEFYKKRFDDQVEKLKMMDHKQVEHWCYLDLRKRGVIA